MPHREGPVGFIVTYDAPVETIIAQADASLSTWKELTTISHVAGMVGRALLSPRKREWEVLTRSLQPLFEKNIDALGSISKRFPDKKRTFIHLPSKLEVTAGGFQFDLRKDIEAQAFIYVPSMQHCSWSMAIFLELDGHPNRLGYENISRCVTQALALEQQ